jgi:hypothetical protein
LLSHCGKAGTIILILCYGNWHKVYTDVRYGMSCGSPLLSSMCICEWTKTKNQRIQAKDVLVLCILLAGDFFVLSGRLFCLQHIQLIHPRPPPSPHPPPSKQSVWVRIGLCLEFRVRVKSSSTTVLATDIQH